MEIDELRLKLSGSACLTNPLILTKSYDLEIKSVECRQISEIPNDDGTKDLVYKLVINETSEILIKSEKETIKARKKGSQSQVLRIVLQDLADRLGKDREQYYQEIMSKLIEIYQNK